MNIIHSTAGYIGEIESYYRPNYTTQDLGSQKPTDFRERAVSSSPTSPERMTGQQLVGEPDQRLMVPGRSGQSAPGRDSSTTSPSDHQHHRLTTSTHGGHNNSQTSSASSSSSHRQDSTQHNNNHRIIKQESSGESLFFKFWRQVLKLIWRTEQQNIWWGVLSQSMGKWWINMLWNMG